MTCCQGHTLQSVRLCLDQLHLGPRGELSARGPRPGGQSALSVHSMLFPRDKAHSGNNRSCSVAEHLSSMGEALALVPNTAKINRLKVKNKFKKMQKTRAWRSDPCPGGSSVPMVESYLPAGQGEVGTRANLPNVLLPWGPGPLCDCSPVAPALLPCPHPGEPSHRPSRA